MPVPLCVHDPQVLKRKLADHGLVQVLHNLPAGDWDKGERASHACPIGSPNSKLVSSRRSVMPGSFGCRNLNCLAGIPPPDLDLKDARVTLVRNLRYAAQRLKAEGIALLIEPLNTRDVPGFFLSRSAQAAGRHR